MSGSKYLLDTNIIIGFLTGKDSVVSFHQVHLQSAEIFVSQITRMELLGYPNITSNEEKRIKQFLNLVEILPITPAIENRVITLRRKTRLKLPDVIIIGTAMENQCILVTCDQEICLKNIENLQIINPDTSQK